MGSIIKFLHQTIGFQLHIYFGIFVMFKFLLLLRRCSNYGINVRWLKYIVNDYFFKTKMASESTAYFFPSIQSNSIVKLLTLLLLN